jgi:hypothetical protein
VHYASGRTPAGSAGQLEGIHARMTVRGRTGPLSFTTVMTGLLALYFLVEAFEPFSAFRLVLGVATAALTVRLAVHGTLVVSEAGIEWRTMTRTRRWPYNAVSYFDLAFRSPVRSASSTRVARVHFADGRAQWLNGLEEPLPVSSTLRVRWWPEGSTSAVDLEEELDALNMTLAGLRQGRTERAAG